jgi:hypothetical protein
MSTVVTPAPEAPAFDIKAKIAERNAIDAARREGKEIPISAAVEAAPAAPKTEEVEHPTRVARSLRRMERQLGEERGRREALEEMLRAGGQPAKPEPAAPKTEDPEPQRKGFADDVKYWRAVAQWDARQEAAKLIGKEREAAGQTEAQQELQRQVERASAKLQEDIKLLPDWDQVQKAAQDDEDAPQFKPSDHAGLMTLIATSDVQAAVLYYLAQKPKEMQEMLDLTAKPAEQIQKFRRLEGRAERLLDKAKEKPDNFGKPAQGSGKSQEDRQHPADEGQTSGRNGVSAAERDARLPRPTTEVATRGGTPAPDQPKPGSAAWMAQRNAAQRMPR